MKPGHSARPFVAPRHLDRPRQWVHLPWLLLGMLFVTALLISSHRLSPVAPVAPVDDAGSDTSEVQPTPGRR